MSCGDRNGTGAGSRGKKHELVLAYLAPILYVYYYGTGMI